MMLKLSCVVEIPEENEEELNSDGGTGPSGETNGNHQ